MLYIRRKTKHQHFFTMNKPYELKITSNGGIHLKAYEPKMVRFVQNNNQQLVEDALYGVILQGSFTAIGIDELYKLIQLDGEARIFEGIGDKKDRIGSAMKQVMTDSSYTEAAKTAKSAIIIFFLSTDDLMMDEMKAFEDNLCLIPENKMIQFIHNEKLSTPAKLVVILGGIMS